MKSTTVVALLLLGLWTGAAPAASPDALTGEVLETRDVEGYTYLRLKTGAGEVWAAVPTVRLAKGAKVSIDQPMTMQNFQSKALGKTFDRIVFGQLAGPDGKPPAGAPQAAAPPGHAGGGLPMTMTPPATAPRAAGPSAGPDPVLSRPPPPAPVKVAKASGPDARTVAEVVQGKGKLKDKTVLVNAQVVKVNNGILGKNWLHVRDGSGSAGDGSNDIVVTTTEQAMPGDVVKLRGTVRTDVTVGQGYAFPVMIEASELKK